MSKYSFPFVTLMKSNKSHYRKPLYQKPLSTLVLGLIPSYFLKISLTVTLPLSQVINLFISGGIFYQHLSWYVWSQHIIYSFNSTHYNLINFLVYLNFFNYIYILFPSIRMEALQIQRLCLTHGLSPEPTIVLGTQYILTK